MPAMAREEIVDIRGMAQVIGLFEHCGHDAPVFVAHEFVLTDGAGHDYGPHHEGMREALFRTDRESERCSICSGARPARLDAVRRHLGPWDGGAAGRAQGQPGARARARHPGVFAEPMIYLRDLRVQLERARDLRSLRVTVLDNDPCPTASSAARRRARDDSRRRRAVSGNADAGHAAGRIRDTSRHLRRRTNDPRRAESSTRASSAATAPRSLTTSAKSCTQI